MTTGELIESMLVTFNEQHRTQDLSLTNGEGYPLVITNVSKSECIIRYK